MSRTTNFVKNKTGKIYIIYIPTHAIDYINNKYMFVRP